MEICTASTDLMLVVFNLDEFQTPLNRVQNSKYPTAKFDTKAFVAMLLCNSIIKLMGTLKF